MNKITKQQYEQIKNESKAIFFFESVSGKRTRANIGCSILDCVNEIQRNAGMVPLIVSVDIGKKISKYELECMYGKDTNKTGKIPKFDRVTYGQTLRFLKELEN